MIPARDSTALAFETAFGTVRLDRRPSSATLQAFDGADAFLLRELEALQLDADGRILVVNDAFGALAVSIAARDSGRVWSWSDSSTARRALEHNLSINGLRPDVVWFVPQSEPPPEAFDAVLLRVPKSMALLEAQLRVLAAIVPPSAAIIGGGMVKHLSPNTREIFAAVLGPVEGSRTEQRARCIRSLGRDLEPDAGSSAVGSTRIEAGEGAGFRLADGLFVDGLPGVFGAKRLDYGTELLLDHLPSVAPDETVVDLGCGTGVIGLRVGVQQRQARLEFVDESYLAVESARRNWQRAFDDRPARFLATDRLEVDDPEGGWADHVICNPPFHQEHVVGDSVAWTMFGDARRALRPGGTFTVVGNRHLGYHAALQKRFGNCTLVASSPKFVVLRSRR